jgi:hypothetical protein
MDRGDYRPIPPTASQPASLYEILQILSLTLFEKTPVNCLFDDDPSQRNSRPRRQPIESIQLMLGQQ